MLSQDPNKTKTIYTLISDEKYSEVIELLESELPSHPQSRCILSLLAYSYYYIQDFHSAANFYDRLVKYFPFVEDYKVYHAQSLWKAGLYEEAIRASYAVHSKKYIKQMTLMRASIKYEMEDIQSSLAILKQYKHQMQTQNNSKSKTIEDPEIMVGEACVLFKEDKFKEALKIFLKVQNTIGYRTDLSYNSAVCYYMLKQFEDMDKIVDDIISRGAHLSVGSGAGGIEVQSVGITYSLKQTFFIEAFNLKIAKEYQLKNVEKANAIFWAMPPRNESEYDSITLHNSALLSMNSDVNESFRKLNFLITQPSFPSETFQNLLLAYINYGFIHLAADVLAENSHLHELFLDPELYEFLDGIILCTTNEDEAFQRFTKLGNIYIAVLRQLTKKLNEAKESKAEERIKSIVNEYLQTLEKYIQVLMHQCKQFWVKENWSAIEHIFEQTREYCDNHQIWRLNYAHVLFMQQKFSEAILFYEPIVKLSVDHSILSVSAMVLANLCVSYIMTSQNEEAEELMKQIEDEEERLLLLNPDEPQYHLCIVNLVIGTLYCSKGNYTFGLQRIFKSLEPLEKKLSADTWYHTKRCLVSYLQILSKQIYIITDDNFGSILQFLDTVEECGREIPASIKQMVTSASDDEQKSDGNFMVSVKKEMKVHSIAYEARLLKIMFYKILE